MQETKIFPVVQVRLLRSALRLHDGKTLAPNWGQDEQLRLDLALDRLRSVLWDLAEKGGDLTVGRYVGWVDRRLALPPVEARLIRLAFEPHTAETLAPNWGQGERKELSAALDLLRPLLQDAENLPGKKPSPPRHGMTALPL